MAIIVKEVLNKSDLKRFIKYPIDVLYKNSPYYVPDLIGDELKVLDREKNPAFRAGCEARYFLAYRDGKIVGRIAGIIHHKANELFGSKSMRFGWLDAEDDKEIFQALFAAVEAWAKQQGLDTIHGPLGFTDLDNEGMLTDGFDILSTMATIYNYPYYPKRMKEMGFISESEYHEFKIMVPDELPEKHLRIANIVSKKYGLSVRKFKNSSEIKPYVKTIFSLVNEAYSVLDNYVPLTEEQKQYYADTYIPMLRWDDVTMIFRDEDDALVGIGISIPNLSKGLQKTRGRLFSWGVLELLKNLMGKNDVVDLLLVGVLPEYQDKGVNAMIFADLIPIYIKNGYRYGESNPELAHNLKVQAQWKYFDRIHDRTRNVFTRPIK